MSSVEPETVAAALPDEEDDVVPQPASASATSAALRQATAPRPRVRPIARTHTGRALDTGARALVAPAGQEREQVAHADRDQDHADREEEGVQPADVQRPDDDPDAETGGGGEDETHCGVDPTCSDRRERRRQVMHETGDRLRAPILRPGRAHEPAADDHAVGSG